jgi:hypothetical protein
MLIHKKLKRDMLAGKITGAVNSFRFNKVVDRRDIVPFFKTKGAVIPQIAKIGKKLAKDIYALL